jgi:hypothetical protein
VLSAEEAPIVNMSQNFDGKQYYGYQFNANKLPTKVLDALLRGIAIYIVSCDHPSDPYAMPSSRDIEADLIIAEHVDRKH